MVKSKLSFGIALKLSQESKLDKCIKTVFLIQTEKNPYIHPLCSKSDICTGTLLFGHPDSLLLHHGGSPDPLSCCYHVTQAARYSKPYVFIIQHAESCCVHNIF